jgi:predicted transcriptional regulator
MSSVTVKLDSEAYAKLKETAAETGKPMIEVLSEAIDAYRRRVFLEGLNADFARLRANHPAWDEEREERSVWDATSADGLEDE